MDCHRNLAIKLACVGGGMYMIYLIQHTVWDAYYRRDFTKRREAKIIALAEGKKKFTEYIAQHIMSQEDIDRITSMPFLELVEALKKEELPRAFALLAYQHKALQVDQRLNCVVEFLYPDLNDVNLDGPLAGAPVSLKECISLKGFDNCNGCAYFLNGPTTVDATVVTAIRSLGGVPFVRTTVPQSMMSTRCSNPINGFTRNPLNLERTCHGSSGGEAALIGGGGSGLGFGTDIGGSVRIPAAMCGIVGFKPTTERVSYKNISKIAQGKLIKPSVGSLTRDVDTCILAMKSIFDSSIIHSLDPETPPLQFAKVKEGHRLRIGYFVDLGCLVPVPAVRRAVLSVKEKLIARGHELIEWKLPFDGYEIMGIFLRALCADGCEGIQKYLKYDLVDPCIRGIYSISTMSRWRLWIKKMLLRLQGDWETALFLDSVSGFSSVTKLEEHARLILELRQKVFDSWLAHSFDAVLCPALGFAAALEHLPSKPSTGMLTFSNLANLLGVPAGTLPSGVKVEAEDLRKLEAAVNCKPIESDDPEETKLYSGYGRLSPLHQSLFSLQEGTEGMPIPVQLIGLPWKDEIVLFAMHEIEAAVQG